MKSKILYIDYLECISPTAGTAHGGASYAKKVIEELLLNADKSVDITIFWKKGFIPGDKVEKYMYSSDKAAIVECEDIPSDLKMGENATIFIPLLRTKRLYKLQELKKAYPKLRICLSIHDVRTMEEGPDPYYRYTQRGYLYLIDGVKFLCKKAAFKYYFKKYVRYTDEILTCSNYSMQEMIKLSNINNITPFYLGVDSENSDAQPNSEKYILFVSANSPVKNFGRALAAFCKYKEEIDNDICLYVTGIDDKKLREIIHKSKKYDQNIVENWVKCFGIVSRDEFQALLHNCLYLLYVSKSEGFGLPILEAAVHGKRTLASSVTSIPEVLGSEAKYVNPFDVNAITQAMKDMGNQCETDEVFTKKTETYLELAKLDLIRTRELILQEHR